MSELVFLHHNQPITTSLALAAGTQNEHDSVILLVRKFIDDLEEFGKVGFETAKEGFSRFEIGGTVVEVENKRGKQGARTEFAFLNEPQATLLITYMRNSDIVRKFKVALVKAFYELRAAVSSAPTSGISDPSKLYPIHEADKIVTSDRVFRAVQRASKAAGMSQAVANDVARKVAHSVSGVDLVGHIAEIAETMKPPPLKDDREGADLFVKQWNASHTAEDETEFDDLYWEYQQFCQREGYRDGGGREMSMAFRRQWNLENLPMYKNRQAGVTT